MLKTLEKTELWNKVEPFIQKLGVSVLFWQEVKSRRSLTIHLTLYSPEGVDMVLIEKVHSLLLPRLEALWGLGSVILHVSSPGVGRIFKSFYEFTYWEGQELSLSVMGFLQPMQGVLVSSTSDTVIVRVRGDEVSVPKEVITQAKLVDSKENKRCHQN